MKLKNNNFDFYELLYRDLRNEKIVIHIDPTDDTIAYVNNTGLELRSMESKTREAIQFSNVIYALMPVVKKNNGIRYEYVPMLTEKNEKSDAREHINRFKNFNIDNLPLIEVAKYLGIKVEKSNALDYLGIYSPRENKIILGSDYEPVFIHELAHAIDVRLDNFISESAFEEVVAELSVVALCKYYNIQNDPSASLDYVIYFFEFCNPAYTHFENIIWHIAEIFETVKFIRQDIKNGIYELRQRAGT